MSNVAVLGASSDTTRYSYLAVNLLKEFNHRPLPIHPKEKEIAGLKVFSDIQEIVDQKIEVDTLTLYVNPGISSKLFNEIIALKPRRVIFNPGSENPDLMKKIMENGIKTEEACTLVLLRTGQF